MSGLILHVMLSKAAPWPWDFVLQCASLPALPSPPPDPPLSPSPHQLLSLSALAPCPHPSLPWSLLLPPGPAAQAGSAKRGPSLITLKSLFIYLFRLQVISPQSWCIPGSWEPTLTAKLQTAVPNSNISGSENELTISNIFFFVGKENLSANLCPHSSKTPEVTEVPIPPADNNQNALLCYPSSGRFIFPLCGFHTV